MNNSKIEQAPSQKEDKQSDINDAEIDDLDIDVGAAGKKKA